MDNVDEVAHDHKFEFSAACKCFTQRNLKTLKPLVAIALIVKVGIYDDY